MIIVITNDLQSIAFSDTHTQTRWMPPFSLASLEMSNGEQLFFFTVVLSLSWSFFHSFSHSAVVETRFSKLNDEKTNKMPFDEKRIYLLCLLAPYVFVCARARSLCEIYFTAANSLIRFSMALGEIERRRRAKSERVKRESVCVFVWYKLCVPFDVMCLCAIIMDM